MQTFFKTFDCLMNFDCFGFADCFVGSDFADCFGLKVNRFGLEESYTGFEGPGL